MQPYIIQRTSDTSRLLQGCELVSTVTPIRICFSFFFFDMALFESVVYWHVYLQSRLKQKNSIKKNNAFYCAVQRYHKQQAFLPTKEKKLSKAGLFSNYV